MEFSGRIWILNIQQQKKNNGGRTDGTKYQYNTVEEAIRDLQDGKIILVTDDPDRENEGDMICAAQFATQENINFMQRMQG